MNKKKIFFWLSPFLLVALYWLGIYWSLRNPMEEINYAGNGGWMRYVMFRPFTETIGRDRIWKEDEGFQMYPYSDDIVGGQEELSVMMFRDSSEWVYWYKYQLNENAYVRMFFEYDSTNKVFLQREVYLYEDDQTVEGVIFYRNYPPTAKIALGFETKVRRSPNNTSLVLGSKGEVLVIP
jgi:fructoselysine 6-phosphate deglycase